MNHRRSKKKAQREALLNSALDAVKELSDLNSISNDDSLSIVESSIDWDALPSGLDPFYKETSKLPEDRALRKRQQIESVLYYSLPLIKDGDTVCDFGAGAGHIGLLIAYFKPSCRVVLVEHNPEKHEMVYGRIKHLESNGIYCSVDIYNTIEDFQRSGRPLDLGVSLHSCGLLTDMTLEYCVRKRAKYVLVPCCYGQIASVKPHTNRITSSKYFGNISPTVMATIQSASDYTVPASDNQFHLSNHFKIAKKCMNVVDNDRQWWAKENGYENVKIHSLSPLCCSPKNNIIIGVPNNSISEFNFEDKVKSIFEKFNPYISSEVKENTLLLPSPTCNYRMRCRFKLEIDNSTEIPILNYSIYEHGKEKIIETFPIASMPIQELMKSLQIYLVQYPNFIEGLEAIHFLSTLYGDHLISLIYSCQLDETQWKEDAKKLQENLLENHGSIGIMAHFKKHKIILDNKDYVIEKLLLKNGKYLEYKQYEGSFSNPNARINERCLDWLMDVSTYIINVDNSVNNLLELYCGCGNHTMALATIFNHVCAVELDKKLCDAAEYNAKLNKISDKITILQIHSEKFCKSLLQQKSYKDIKFDIVLVDPPRAGLDKDTLNSVLEFKYILYISCNPDSLIRDIDTLKHSHQITHFSIFDQFAHTSHLEVAAVFQKIK